MQNHTQVLASTGPAATHEVEVESADDIIDYRQATRVIGVSLATLYSLVSRKRLPHIRLSARLVRFSRQELEEWRDAHRVEPADGQRVQARK